MFYVDGMNAVHPHTGADTGLSRGTSVSFVTEAGPGFAELEIFPWIIEDGRWRNVSTLPADGAEITAIPVALDKIR